MTKVFSKNDLIRYIYQETSLAENKVIEILITTDSKFNAQYQELRVALDELNKNTSSPPDRVIDNIIRYSREANLNTKK
jgi:hypothetical protein